MHRAVHIRCVARVNRTCSVLGSTGQHGAVTAFTASTSTQTACFGIITPEIVGGGSAAALSLLQRAASDSQLDMRLSHTTPTALTHK
jgi:hypothetical protein